MRLALLIVGTLLLAFGTLFFLQGLDVVHWPASSTMLDQRVWVWRGALIAGVGAVLIHFGRRR